MAVDKKFFVGINLQNNALNNATIGSNSNMTGGGSFRFDSASGRLEYCDSSEKVQAVANLADISAVTGGLILQGGYDAATNTPDIADGSALKGFFWVVTEAGSFLGESVQVGDSLIAKVDNAGASIGDWLILQGNIVIATDSVDGIVRLATQAEVDAGTEGGAVVVTPATLQGKIDSQVNPYADSVAATAQSNAESFATTAASTAQTNAENYAKSVADTAQSNAESYADSLAPNYDPAGSAATAQSNAETFAANAARTAEISANAYTDSKISQEVIDRNAAIATAKSEAITESESYTDSAIAQEVIDRNAAIATAKSEAIADSNAYTDSVAATTLADANSYADTAASNALSDANSYTDTQIAAQSFSATYADTDWTLNRGVYILTVNHGKGYTAPKVSCYVSGNLVEFGVVFVDSGTIELKSNVIPPASVNVGVSI